MFSIDALTAAVAVVPSDVWAAPPPKAIPGVDDTVNTIFGWGLWIVSVLSLISLLLVAYTGYEAYRRDNGAAFMEKAKIWLIASIIGANADKIAGIFFPGIRITATPVPIPGLEGPVIGVIGNIVWVLQWAALFSIVLIAIQGFLAYKHDALGDFVSKFAVWIAASLVVAFVTQIAGAFFPAVLTLG